MRSGNIPTAMAALHASNSRYPLDREEVVWLQKIDHQLQITRIPVSGYSQALGNEFHHTTSLVDHDFPHAP